MNSHRVKLMCPTRWQDKCARRIEWVRAIRNDDGIMVPGSDSTWNVAQKRRKGACESLASLVLFFAIIPVLVGNSKKDPLTRVPESKIWSTEAMYYFPCICYLL